MYLSVMDKLSISFHHLSLSILNSTIKTVGGNHVNITWFILWP